MLVLGSIVMPTLERTKQEDARVSINHYALATTHDHTRINYDWLIMRETGFVF